MTVVFRTDIGAYTGKGSPLTKEEVDGNFHDLLTRTTDIENGVEFACESVDYTGASITFNWSDDTSSGPFMLPVATFHAVGEWLNSMPLSYLDVFTVTGTGTFLTLVDHTTPAYPAPFDPAAVSDDTAGDPLYLMISESVDVSGLMEYRGNYAASTSYFVNDVFTSSDYGLFHVLVGHIAGLVFDPDAVNDDDEPLYRQLAGPPFSAVTTVAATDYTLSRADIGKMLRVIAITSTVTFPAGIDFGPGNPEIHFMQRGPGPVVFSPESGAVTINPQREGYETSTPYVGAVVTAKYVGLNEWDLIGPFGAELTA